jgi:hypothetical protein
MLAIKLPHAKWLDGWSSLQPRSPAHMHVSNMDNGDAEKAII